ncbi:MULTISPECIES: acyl carrier protein [unclassified Streptomyces]|uniref:acyl carrier protein n=1 Tax=unclassified Streptomyces TaxID=2593676 RepID=UPI00339E07E3
MNESTVLSTIAGQLRVQGYDIGPDEYDADLIGAGLNSVNMIRLLSRLEDEFDVDFPVARLFTEPVSVARLAAEVISQCPAGR